MSATLTSTPAADGYRMPAEWDNHAGCFLIWPERTDNWRDGAKPAQRAWVTLIEAIAAAEPVTAMEPPPRLRRLAAATAAYIKLRTKRAPRPQ